jgi:hypothetical protein
MVVRLADQWKNTPKWGKAARSAVVVLMCATLVSVWAVREPGINSFARGFEARIRATADVKAIRAWASTIAVPTAQGSVPEVDKSLWPDCVNALAPKDVYFLGGAKGVRLDWGGGFAGHYGLVVGEEDMVLPGTTEPDLIVPIQAGAYLFFPQR